MPPESWSDRELVTAICDGDKQALATLLIDVCGPMIEFLAKKFAYDDLLGDLCVRLLQNECSALRDWRGTATLKTYVGAIATRLCLTEKRVNVKQSVRFRPLNQWDGASGERETAQESTTNQKLQRSQLLRAIDQLKSEDDRLVMLLHCLEEEPLDEVATIIKKTPATTRVIKHRALKRLRLILDGEMDHA